MRKPHAFLTRVSVVSFAVVTVLAASSTTGTPSADAFPPDVPPVEQVQSELDGLTVAAEGSMSGYDRDLFPHWSTVSGNCNTREHVLRRDGDNVSVGDDCYPTSGSWYSYFDGETRTSAPDIDIDHIVALAEAWRSGASDWSTSRREAFANDIEGPQLIAVTSEVNSSKSDNDPTEWKPPRTASYCGYAKFWIHTKYRWDLTLQQAEKTELQSMLNTCVY